MPHYSSPIYQHPVHLPPPTFRTIFTTAYKFKYLGFQILPSQMETATAIQSPFGTCIRPSNKTDSGRYHNRSIAFTTVLNKGFPSFSHPRAGLRGVSFQSQKNRSVIRASSSFDSTGRSAPIAPLQLDSPIGQFLSQILISHPHLVPAAVDQQLEQLQTDRDAEKQNEEPSAASTDLVLYKRIAEVKANERKKALEEILYALLVQKFMDANVSLISSVTRSPPTWPHEDDKLELLHSPEALEMIQSHLALILGNRVGDSTSVAEISKLRVGQVYAASVMYGYFVKRIDQRFQLEKTTRILPEGLDRENDNIQQQVAGDERVPQTHPEVTSWSELPNSGPALKSSRLRNYVMSFDGESLQRYATIRSKEAVHIIEKHTEALFGRPEIVITPEGRVDSSKDEVIKISFGGLRRLVLEAVTFGSFLWDVESYVDSRYHFVAS